MNSPNTDFTNSSWLLYDFFSPFLVLHIMFQKAIPGGGYVAAGAYHGLNRNLLTNSEGRVVQTGAMFAAFSPAINVGLTGLKKINLAADVQTGKNALGAWGVGSYFYFADNVSLLVGPVFFFDKNLQPGGRNHLWTIQLDIDFPLHK